MPPFILLRPVSLHSALFGIWHLMDYMWQCFKNRSLFLPRTCAVNWLNSALSPVVYGDIVLSINTQYNTIQYLGRF